MRRTILALATLLPAAAHAEATSAPPYSLFAKPVASFNAIPAAKRTKLILIERVTNQSGVPIAPPPHFTIQAAAGPIPLPIAADGSFTVPVTDALLAEDPKIATDQPKGSMEINLSVGIIPPPAASVPYAWCLDAAAQAQEAANLAAKAQGGLLGSLFGPTVRGLVVSFPGTGTITLVSAGKREALPANPNGTVTIPLDRPAGAEVQFSTKPKEITLDLK